MKYSIFKPNSKNTGSLFSFEIGSSKDGKTGLYVRIIQQAGWNESSKTGSFGANAKDPNKSTNIKLSVTEAGEILSSFKTRVPFVAFHKNNDDTTIIRFSPWDKDRTIKEQNGDKTYKTNAFGISISKNSSSQFKIALEAVETEVLSLLLKEFINQSLYEAKESYSSSQQTNQELEKPDQKKSSKQESPPEEDYDDVPF